MDIINAKPVIKWAGGKTQLLPVLRENLDVIKKSEELTYIEPFLGAGALFINLASEDRFEKYIINDINSNLINLYIQIKDNVEQLIEKLSILKNEYLIKDMESRKEYYYKSRDVFNYYSLKDEKNLDDKISLAAYFIFINKTCFNGLYRENKKGEFNVPTGRYKNPSIYSEDELFALSEILNMKDENGNDKVEIYNLSYDDLLLKLKPSKAFIYFDPPYRPITDGGFTTYHRSSFNDEDQINLADIYRLCDEKGHYCMLSNSDPKNRDPEDEFFDELYRGFNIDRVSAKRMINSDGAKRGAITEILVTNFK